MKSSFLGRSRFVLFAVMIFGAVLLTKLFWVQVMHAGAYSDAALRQYVTPSSNIFERGTIYFKTNDGHLVSAATQTSGYKVAVDSTKISDPESAYEKLSKIVVLDHENFITRASDKTDPYEEVSHRLSQNEADKISKLKIPGVSVFKEKWRFYPGGDLASQALGLVGYDQNELGGRYGLEREYNSVLSRNADNPYVNFFAEVFSDINKTLFDSENKEGDIVTTIDPRVEDYLQKKLGQVKATYSPDSIGGIIMNPQDGSIYALAAKPDFDPNNFSQAKTSELANPLVESVFEFGSVVKPLVMAAALDAGVVTANTIYNDQGKVTVEKHEIYNFDKKGRGPGTTMQEVLSQSLNTGMVFVEEKLGRVPERNYFLGYGIKDKTGIDLPNETGSLISNILTSPREIEYANAAFGQGIALTPVELIRALASLGNGGSLVVPHVVSEIKYSDGTKKTLEYDSTPTKISKETSQEITRMLVTVMDKAIKDGKAKFDHYSVAVKTGTAQVADKSTGGYYEDRHTHSFMGYFPAYNPKFIIFLYAVNPKGVQYAATTWTDPFLDITKFLLNYYNVPPDR